MKRILWVILGITGFVLLTLFWPSTTTQPPAAPPLSVPAAAAPKPQTPRLALLSTSDRTSARGVTVEGKFKNITGDRIGPITVRVLWFANHEMPLGTRNREGYFDAAPGEEKSFTLTSPSDPAMVAYRIEFRDERGREIPHRDDRSK